MITRSGSVITDVMCLMNSASKSEIKAIKIAAGFARNLSFGDATVTSVSLEHEGLWIFQRAKTAYVEMETYAGIAELVINIRSQTCSSFELKPDHAELLPLWAAFPDYSSVTSGWRQGFGEHYMCIWHRWWSTITDAEKRDYRVRFPEPTDAERIATAGGWAAFYDEMADVPADPSSIVDSTR